MKYLKSYNESLNDVKSDIKDILRDCEDIGLTVSIDMHPRGYFIQISCVNSSVQVQFKDIRSNVEHLISYMKSTGCSRFNYVDTLAEFNIYHQRYHDEWGGRDSHRIANDGKIDGILPPNDDSRSSWIGIGKILFF